jgi:hypothetical protein
MDFYLENVSKRKELRETEFDLWVFESATKRAKKPKEVDGAKDEKALDDFSSKWVLHGEVYRNVINASLTLCVSVARLERLRFLHCGKGEHFGADLELMMLRYAPLSKGLQVGRIICCASFHRSCLFVRLQSQLRCLSVCKKSGTLLVNVSRRL